jgi:hypothetical protein
VPARGRRAEEPMTDGFTGGGIGRQQEGFRHLVVALSKLSWTCAWTRSWSGQPVRAAWLDTAMAHVEWLSRADAL